MPPETLIFIAFALVVLSLIVYGAVHGTRVTRERREALAALAATIGFAFAVEDDHALPGQLGPFGTFNTGDRRAAHNVMTGTTHLAGRPVALRIGDYRYTTTSGTGKDRRTTTHHLSFLHARLPLAINATLAVRLEHFFDRIAGAIGFEDIDFESAEFSRRFHVKSDDRKFAYDLLDPRMIEWYLSVEPPPLEMIGRDLLLVDGRVWTPEQVQERLTWLVAFFDRWPAHLVQRLDSSPSR